MNKAIICVFTFILFLVFPFQILAANYGAGKYGYGNYNEGDATAPTGGSITYTDDYYTITSVSLTVADGTDTGSGINTATRIVQRKSATLTNDVCGTYSSFATITPTGTYPNFTDSTVLSDNCYIYRYLVSDNVGNQATYTSTNVAKVDTVAPTLTILAPTASSIGATINWSTNESTTSRVEYGTDSSYGLTTANTSDSTSQLTGLVICSEYHYRVRSIDTATNETIGSDNKIMTDGCSNSQPSGSTTLGVTTCNDSITSSTPYLFEIRTTKTMATLYFSPPSSPYSSFYVSYSRKPDVDEYGFEYKQEYSGGVLKLPIKLLNPNTKYYFKIRAGNGCATGKWSNTMMATTNSKTYFYNQKTISPIVTKKIILNKTNKVEPVAVKVEPTITPVPISIPIMEPVPTKSKFCILGWCW